MEKACMEGLNPEGSWGSEQERDVISSLMRDRSGHEIIQSLAEQRKNVAFLLCEMVSLSWL